MAEKAQKRAKRAHFFVPLKKIRKNQVFFSKFLEEKLYGSILIIKVCSKGFKFA
jgi:hypothetical protein